MAIPVLVGADLFGNDTSPDCFRRLAQGVIIQAARDAHKGDRDAALWLLDLDTADTWLALADVDRQSIINFLKSGCKWAKWRNGKRLKKGSRRNVDK
jgi:hypothetical protein